MPVRIARPLPLLAWWIAATALPFAVVLPASLAIILSLAWGTLPGLQGYRYLLPTNLLLFVAGAIASLLSGAALSVSQASALRRTLPTWPLLPSARRWAYGTLAGSLSNAVLAAAADLLPGTLGGVTVPAPLYGAVATTVSGAVFGLLQPAFARWPRWLIWQWLLAHALSSLLYYPIYSTSRTFLNGLAPENGWASHPAGLLFLASTTAAQGLLLGTSMALGTGVVLLQVRKRLPPIPTNAELQEASTNFDIEDIQPFFERVSTLIESGFARPQIDRLATFVLRLKHDEEDGLDFLVTYRGHPTIMRVRFFMDDVDAPDTFVFTAPPLASAISEEMRRYAEELGR